MNITAITIRTEIPAEVADDAYAAAVAYGFDYQVTAHTVTQLTVDFSTDEPNKVGPFVSRLEAIGRMSRTSR